MPQQEISPTPSTINTGREEQFSYIWHVNHECFSERVLFNTNCTYFQLYLGENKLHSVKWWWLPLCTLYLTNVLNWIFIELAHWNNSPKVDMSLYTDTLFWFRAKQSLLLLLDAVCLVFRLRRTRVWSTIYRTWSWGDHRNHYTTDAVYG